MADRLQHARETGDYSHIPGSDYMIKELRSGREELCRLGGIGHDTNTRWQDVITDLQDELEAQKTKQKRFEDSYKQDRLSRRKTISGIGKTDLPILRDSIDFHLWDQAMDEILQALKESETRH